MSEIYMICATLDSIPCIDPGPGSPFKIGLSDNPDARLRALQTASPFSLFLRATWPFASRVSAMDFESACHSRLSAWGLTGEWFFGDISEAEMIVDQIFYETFPMGLP
ncbi:MAG: GIY-YIG nuclease family protein [Beijerinckiaceae bacterium]|nr:GIY-YIG nuclease family protein [Beijerinckiaceae bacterium]